MKQFLLILNFVWLTSALQAQYQGAQNSGLGILGVVNDNLFSSNCNPSILSNLDSNQVGLTFQKTGFAGRALQTGINAKFDVKNIYLGLGLHSFGNAYFNDANAIINLSKPLSNKQSIGVQFNFSRQFNAVQATKHLVAVGAGYQSKINHFIDLGIAIKRILYNELDPNYNASNLHQNSGTIGLKINTNNNFTLLPEVSIFDNASPRLGIGGKLKQKNYTLLAGIGNYDGLLNVGLEIPINQFNFTLSYGYYQRVGSYVNANLVYLW